MFLDLIALSQTPIQKSLPKDVVEQALQQSPFIPFAGALNLRDVGASAPSNVKRGLIFRSGTLTPLLPESLDRLHTDFHIRRLFDLRSQRETESDPPTAIKGIERVWLAPGKAPDHVDIAQFAGNGGAKGYSVMYLDVLAVLAPTFKAVFEHLRDRPDEGILFHCNAGKDRTGTLAAMILVLADVPHNIIASEYMLTRIGVEPERERLERNFVRAFGAIDYAKPGILELSGVSSEAMIAFLNAMEEKFGGVDGYLKSQFGFSEDDVKKIKANLAG